MHNHTIDCIYRYKHGDNMKLAILKIGSRISKSGTAASAGESFAIASLLSELDGVEVDVYTKSLTRKPDDPHPLTDLYIKDIEDYEKAYTGYDALIVIGGNVNFFGGQESRQDLLNYTIINNFKGDIFYLLVDSKLILKNIWKSVEAKEWGSKYRKEDIEIVRDDIVYISQFYDIEAVKKLVEKTKIPIKDVRHFRLEQWVFMHDRLPKIPHIEDILYGGSFRGGSREKKFIKYYFGHKNIVDVRMFGNIKEKQFNTKKTGALRPPIFEKPVQFEDVKHRMGGALSTIIVGDKFYENKIVTLRVYESILSNTITFIDREFDPQMKIFTSQVLRDLLYIDSIDDIYKTLDKLKKNPAALLAILDLQYVDTYISSEKYAKGLYDCIFN